MRPSYLTSRYLLNINNQNIGSHKYLYANVHGSLCKIAQIWKQAKYPSIGERTDAFWLQPNSTVQQYKGLLIQSYQKNLKSVTLRESIQARKDYVQYDSISVIV